MNPDLPPLPRRFEGWIVPGAVPSRLLASHIPLPVMQRHPAPAGTSFRAPKERLLRDSKVPPQWNRSFRACVLMWARAHAVYDTRLGVFGFVDCSGMAPVWFSTLREIAVRQPWAA